ncbi:hypothetical protein DUE52_00680 [Larkinella punicea]|uniref:Uncharacterized protein n=1 Tax=Larkinella punicea TaxID=2315727 RepID=A0A368JZ46_9BACT|nr:hypothetical protein DUE52_00680 [Larkinella punicea]
MIFLWLNANVFQNDPKGVVCSAVKVRRITMQKIALSQRIPVSFGIVDNGDEKVRTPDRSV